MMIIRTFLLCMILVTQLPCFAVNGKDEIKKEAIKKNKHWKKSHFSKLTPEQKKAVFKMYLGIPEKREFKSMDEIAKKSPRCLLLFKNDDVLPSAFISYTKKDSLKHVCLIGDNGTEHAKKALIKKCLKLNNSPKWTTVVFNDPCACPRGEEAESNNELLEKIINLMIIASKL